MSNSTTARGQQSEQVSVKDQTARANTVRGKFCYFGVADDPTGQATTSG